MNFLKEKKEDYKVGDMIFWMVMMMKFRSEDVRTPLIPLPALRTGYLMTKMLRSR